MVCMGAGGAKCATNDRVPSVLHNGMGLGFAMGDPVVHRILIRLQR